ncbi:aspartate aminotransferase family protein [Mesorhizobium dulcispinae]|uniref:aspartate aminotransferase family protein n=1 Tax=Mesorhizobium dulcispinae TaxID=3072316 RepID=UPI002A247119|nr:aspartate aminotransferase family protein [Mesorhizobium sp. VK23D]MDX8517515.1 aspartate aminotransferase family protein [Mesorhizobium sp. VK23D]
MNRTAIVNTDPEAALADAQARYAASNSESLTRHEEACEVFPGGTTRTVLFYPPFPLTMVRGEGARLWDADGHEYIDFLAEYTAAAYGHSHPKIRAAINKALDGGIDLGGHNRFEARLAAALCSRFPSIDLVRFTNSGTEANLMAVSAACAITGRTKVLVFDGAYHGGVFLFANGGSPINAPFGFVVANYNDLNQTIDLVEQQANDLAAVLIEPMMGVAGCLPADRAFLQALRDATHKHGILLIFDEVMTSRLSPGGLQEFHGILPDITTLGKYIGGGISCGAFGGRKDIMDRFDPRKQGSFPHAGTFNNNVLTMSAGIAGLTEVYTPEAVRQLNGLGDRMRSRLNQLAQAESVRMCFTGLGSMMSVHMRSGPIHTPADALKGNATLRQLFFFDMIERGVWMAPRGMINLSLPITQEDSERFVASVQEFIESRRSLLGP